METSRSLWLLLFFGFWICDMLRNNINLAVIAMAKPRYLDPSLIIKYQIEETKNQTNFDWDEYQVAYILSSYYWMYWITQLPGGVLGYYFGGKFLFAVTILSSAIITFAIPLAARRSLATLLTLRVIEGFIGGSLLPSLHEVTARWIPPEDQSAFLTSYLGSSLGIACCYISGGFLMETYGWEAIFYLEGILGVVLWIFWLILIFISPSHYDKPPEMRKSIIIYMNEWNWQNKMGIPWKSILLSGPLWINISTQFGALWGDFALTNLTPVYFNFVYGFNVSSTGLITGLPFITKWLFSYLFGCITEYTRIISVQTSRRIATVLCTIGPGMFILLMSATVGSAFWAITYMMIAVTLQGTIPAGPMGALIELSPNYAGILQGISGAAGALSGALGPLFLAYLTRKAQKHSQWSSFFWVTAVLLFYVGFVDLLFSSSTIQKWNAGVPIRTEEEGKKQSKQEKKK